MTTSTIAVIGGTGNLGLGLARLWAAAGLNVIIGSRSAEKAAAAASTIAACGGGDHNAAAATRADIVVVTVPYASQEETLRDIAGACRNKIVVDTTVPLAPPKVWEIELPIAASAGMRAQRILGPDVRVVSAFHNVGAAKLREGARADCDVLVFGDDKEARAVVMELAGRIATRGVDGGRLANSVAAEALTAVLIGINRRYKVAGAGIRITGLS